MLTSLFIKDDLTPFNYPNPILGQAIHQLIDLPVEAADVGLVGEGLSLFEKTFNKTKTPSRQTHS